MSTHPKILLVDDRPENLLAFEAQLKDQQAEFIKATSGAMALDLLLSHEVALALLDVQMPEMDGFELAEIMRSSERTKSIPIIFVTAGLHESARIFKGYDAGAVDFLVKPIDAHVLNGKVSVFLQLYRQRRLLVERVEELEAAHEALRVNEQWLRLAQEAAGAGTWQWDLRTNGHVWSDEVWKLYGLERGAGIASQATWLEAIVPEDRVHAREAASEAARSGSTLTIEFRTRKPDGGMRHLLSRGQPQRDKRGRPEKYLGIVIDISDRKEAEEALQQSREGLRRLAGASLSVIGKADLEGMLQAIAEAALALTGARAATCGHGFVAGREVVGGSACVPGAPGCPPGQMFVMQKGGVHTVLVEGADAIRLNDEQLKSHAKWWGLPEGHIPMRGLLGVPMIGRNGRPTGMILATDKETGEFSPEDESLLKQLAMVASLALQHIEARISLEEADRRKNDFLAMLSHELRNPLAPIRNSIFILDRAAPGSEQAKRAQSIIDRQVAHMTRLVDDLLDVTRISRGKIQLQRESLDLADVVRRSVEDNRAAFSVNRLTLETSIPEGAIHVNGDRTRIAQVFGNLLHNASKFTAAGGRVIVVLEANEKLGQAIARVRDDGAGIDPEMQQRIFVPFTQADTTLDRSKGGLGLGLSLVKAIVEMHGGTVSVRSEGLGKGAEFTVRLPLEAPRAHAEQQRQLVSTKAQRILVIEDNVDSATSLRELLELGGHTVEVALTGPEGIEKAGTFKPSIILCDLGLPGMDGYQVARALRTDRALQGIKLVALSGYAGTEDVSRAREAGFDAHLAKPPSMEKLEEALTRETSEDSAPEGAGASKDDRVSP